MASAAPSQSPLPMNPATAMRRIGAMIYDAMLVIAVLFVATVPATMIAISRHKLLIPADVGLFVYILYLLWLTAVGIFFFGFFWTRRGQTLGMQVWKLRVEDEQGNLLSWSLVLRRLLFATLPWVPGFACLTISERLHSQSLKGCGEFLLLLVLFNFLTARFSADRRTWHDRMSKSRVIVLQG